MIRHIKKIPTPLALVLIIGFLAAVSYSSTYLFGDATYKSVSAETDIEPQNIEVTNTSDSGFTISWTTNDKATGAIVISKKSFSSQTFFDERDTQNKLDSYNVHSVQIRDLNPNSQYSFKILSAGKPFQEKTSRYSGQTAPESPPSNNNLEPAYGVIILPNNQPANDTIVYITLDGAQTLSTLVNNQGSWLMPLNIAKSSNLTAFQPSSDRIDINIMAKNIFDEAWALTDTLNDSPVPAMMIGKTYDFRRQQAKKTNTPAKTFAQATETQTDSAVLGETDTTPSAEIKTPEPDTKNTNYNITITQPKNNASLITNKPLFKGTGVPKKKVTISIGITDPITDSISVNQEGIWQYTPIKDLMPGKQSVTVTSESIDSEKKAVTHVFEILKSGTQVLGIATPSATLTPTPTEPVIGTPPPQSGTFTPTLIILVVSLMFIFSAGLLYVI